MDVGIGTEVAHFYFWEYINRIFFACSSTEWSCAKKKGQFEFYKVLCLYSVFTPYATSL
jgi:hypothetical protein